MTSSLIGSESYTVSLQVGPEFALMADEARLIAIAETTLKHQNISRGSLSIVLTDDMQVQELNRTFRGIDAPTDVLSFPNQKPPSHALSALVDEAGPESPLPTLILPAEMSTEDAEYLGDIIIAVPYTVQQVQRLNKPFADELDLLVVHGVLHLLGYDHATPEEEADMWAIQHQILAQ